MPVREAAEQEVFPDMMNHLEKLNIFRLLYWKQVFVLP